MVATKRTIGEITANLKFIRALFLTSYAGLDLPVNLFKSPAFFRLKKKNVELCQNIKFGKCLRRRTL